MDYLDPKTEQRSRIMLLLGYGLVAIAIGIASLLLLYQAEGFNIDKRGDVIQNGLVFVSSSPNGAAVYLNDKRYKSNTNTRAVIPAGRYNLRISETGYRPWERPVWVAGGDVQYFDYPLLFPENLQTTLVTELNADPALSSQSLDRRWILMADPATPGTFTLYDLKNPAKPVVSTVALPAGSFTPSTGNQTWTAVEWASDNRHLLLRHDYTNDAGAGHEYLVLDRDTPSDSVNLTSTLNLNPNETVGLFNGGTDQVYVYDITGLTLRRLRADTGQEVNIWNHILAFKAYGNSKVLYVSDQAPSGKATPGLVNVVLQDGQQVTTLRTLAPAGNGTYVLNLVQYSGDWYVAVASTSDAAAYIYKNPQSQQMAAGIYPSPWRRIALAGVSYLSFSSNAQFLMAENGQSFVVYDLENIAQYRYTTTQPIDAPQSHAVWLDDSRVAYASNSKLQVFDYDYQNVQTLMPANAGYVPFLAPDSSYLYALRAAGGDNKAALTSTSLRIAP